MLKTMGMTVLVALLAAAPVAAQDSGTSLLGGVLRAMRLPTVAQEARVLGVPEQDLQSIFKTARQRDIPASNLAELLAAENDAIRKHGPIDNFGAFVQQKLDAGLRGRDLADAIHAEHAARGMGKGRQVEAGKSAKQPGKSAMQPGKSGSYDKPGAADEHGNKPDSPGKSEDKGRKGGTQ